MACRIVFTLGIFFFVTNAVLSDDYSGYSTRDVGQRQVRRCPTCPPDSPESLSSPWYGSPIVYGQEIAIPSTDRASDPRSSAPSFQDQRGYRRGTQSSDFSPSSSFVKNFYAHPASVASSSNDDSYIHKTRRPSKNWNSRSQPPALISPDLFVSSTSTKFDPVEDHDFPYDLAASSSSPLAERYRELDNTFGKPHQVPARRVGRHYGNANAYPRSDDDHEKSQNSINEERLRAIETPSRKMVWVVYRADAEPESSIENENFAAIPTRSDGVKMINKNFQRVEPMSDSQLENVVRRAIAAASRQHRREDALYGRSSRRGVYSNDHQSEDEKISHVSGCDPVNEDGRRFYPNEAVARSQTGRKIYQDRLSEAEIDRLPVKKSRNHFEPRDRIICVGSTGNREIVTGRRYGDRDAGIISYGEEPEVEDEKESSDSSEDEEDDEKKIGDFGKDMSRSDYEQRDRNVNSALSGNLEMVKGSRYRDEGAGINFYGEEPEATGPEEWSGSSEDEEDDVKKIDDLGKKRSRNYSEHRDRNINFGSYGDRKIMTGSRDGGEDAGIIFYQKKPELIGRHRQPESVRLSVLKSRAHFAPQDENIDAGSNGNREIITGSRYGDGDAGIMFNQEKPEINGRFGQPEATRRPNGNINSGLAKNGEIMTGSHYRDGDAGIVFYREKSGVTGRLGQPEAACGPDGNVDTDSSEDREIVTGSRHGNKDAEIVCYKEEPEVERQDEEDEEKKVDNLGRENNDKTEKSMQISSDRYRTVEKDGDAEEPNVKPKLTNYRTHSRSDEEVSTGEEYEAGNKEIDQIEERTNAPIIGKKSDRKEIVGAMNPDFFEDMERPPTATEPPLTLNFDSLDTSSPRLRSSNTGNL